MSRPRVDHRSASKSEYEKFCESHPKIKLTYKQYTDIIYLWNKNLSTYILESAEKVKIPFGFGPIAINKKITTRYFIDKGGEKHCILPVDWKKTKEIGKKVFILNNHTDGYRYKWYWFKKEAKIKFSEIWAFKPSRENSILLNRYLTTKKDKPYSDMYMQWHKGRV